MATMMATVTASFVYLSKADKRDREYCETFQHTLQNALDVNKDGKLQPSELRPFVGTEFTENPQYTSAEIANMNAYNFGVVFASSDRKTVNSVEIPSVVAERYLQRTTQTK